MSQHKGPPELCLDCARDRARDERAPRRRLWPRIDMLEAQTAELYALRSQLEALMPYVQHKLTCPTYDKDRFGVPFTCDCGLASLLEEADPDVADTAWAIIAHHHKHRTGG